jgi:Family of unknown function (DUF6282)
MNNLQEKIKTIIKQAIDLHVHVGPEIIPRKYTVPELYEAEKDNLRGVAVKNHFFATTPMNNKTTLGCRELIIVNSVTLNKYNGGLNSDIIRASSDLNRYPIIVWLPTLHTQKFIESNEYEIPQEWIGESKIQLKKSTDIGIVELFDNTGELNGRFIKVLEEIKKCGAILATGHVSWEEIFKIVKFAKENIGINKIILTHPIYQKINMPIEVQKELTQYDGVFVEQCFSMLSIDKIPAQVIADQIKAVGANNCIVSSDVGQSYSPSPAEALLIFCQKLYNCGITLEELETMLVTNPNNLIFDTLKPFSKYHKGELE